MPFDDELNSWSSELRSLKNVILTPHIGGSTEEAQSMIGEEVSGALTRYLNQGSTTGAVNFPEVDLRAIAADEPGRVRVCHVHVNQPGVLRQVNEVLSPYNVEKQFSDSKGDVAYLMADIADVSLRDINRLREQIRQLPKGPGSRNLDGKYQRPLDQIEAKLKSLDEVEKVAAKPDRQLLVLDTSGERTKAAVGVGNVDTAEHVTVFTPGMNSTVEGGSLGDYDRSMDHLQQDALQQSYDYGDGGDVAAVTWLGYEAPQGSEIFDPDRSVAGASTAQRGAADLANFYRGINESRADDPHLVAMGHSYGSTTTGYALQEEGVGVDAAVTMGSPGLGTDTRSDLHVPGGWMYNLESKWDGVADLGAFGGDPSKNWQVDQLSTSDAVAPDGRHLKESSWHGTGGPTGYLTPGTTSQYNASSIAAGVHDLAIPESRS